MCIAGSVGEGGRNDRGDVKTVQILLNMHAAALNLPAQLAEDGVIGPNTLAAIEAFQRQVMGLARPDRRIDPGGPTLAKLGAGLEEGLAAEKLRGILINAREADLGKYAAVLVAKMQERRISTPL
jgi:putative chitinase